MDIRRLNCVKSFERIGMTDADSFLGEYAQKGPFLLLEEGAITPGQFRDEVRKLIKGDVTDEQAVADAVLSGKIGGFGCDVYSTEPFDKEHPFHELLNRPNVCLTPHMAWGAAEARQRCMDEIGENIRAFMCGVHRNRVV